MTSNRSVSVGRDVRNSIIWTGNLYLGSTDHASDLLLSLLPATRSFDWQAAAGNRLGIFQGGLQHHPKLTFEGEEYVPLRLVFEKLSQFEHRVQAKIAGLIEERFAKFESKISVFCRNLPSLARYVKDHGDLPEVIDVADREFRRHGFEQGIVSFPDRTITRSNSFLKHASLIDPALVNPAMTCSSPGCRNPASFGLYCALHGFGRITFGQDSHLLSASVEAPKGEKKQNKKPEAAKPKPVLTGSLLRNDFPVTPNLDWWSSLYSFAPSRKEIRRDKIGWVRSCDTETCFAEIAVYGELSIGDSIHFEKSDLHMVVPRDAEFTMDTKPLTPALTVAALGNLNVNKFVGLMGAAPKSKSDQFQYPSLLSGIGTHDTFGPMCVLKMKVTKQVEKFEDVHRAEFA